VGSNEKKKSKRKKQEKDGYCSDQEKQNAKTKITKDHCAAKATNRLGNQLVKGGGKGRIRKNVGGTNTVPHIQKNNTRGGRRDGLQLQKKRGKNFLDKLTE